MVHIEVAEWLNGLMNWPKSNDPPTHLSNGFIKSMLDSCTLKFVIFTVLNHDRQKIFTFWLINTN